MPTIDRILAAHADPQQPGATFRAVDSALAEVPGTILFTILIHHPAQRQSERFYSNKPTEYPVGGRKPVTDTAWMQQVVHGGRPYLGRTAADIEWAFYDHALIAALGCQSVLNMPVRWCGQTVGTLNLLHGAGHYHEGHIEAVRLIAHLALPAMLAIPRD